MLKIDWRYLHHLSHIDLDPMNSGTVLMAWQALSKQMDSFLFLSRYVAQQCSKPVSLLGDQKGLRMIKVGGLHHSWLSLEKGHCIKHNLLFYFQLSSWSEVLDLQVGVEWFLRRTGAAATAHLEVFFPPIKNFFLSFSKAGGFIRSRAGVEHPDIQFHFLPSQVPLLIIIITFTSQGSLFLVISI